MIEISQSLKYLFHRRFDLVRTLYRVPETSSYLNVDFEQSNDAMRSSVKPKKGSIHN